MEHTNFLEKFASQFAQSASVKNVFGEPITSGEKIIIPVARIAYGFGGGYGQQEKKKSQQGSDTSGETVPDGKPQGEGMGGGGGMFAKPAGVYEISSSGTRFIPVMNLKPLLVGIMVGFFLKAWMTCRRKK